MMKSLLRATVAASLVTVGATGAWAGEIKVGSVAGVTGPIATMQPKTDLDPDVRLPARDPSQKIQSDRPLARSLIIG